MGNIEPKGRTYSSTHYTIYKSNKNTFEEVIDKLVADGLDIPPKFLEENISKEEKREFILSCLIPKEGAKIAEMFKDIRKAKTRPEHLKSP